MKLINVHTVRLEDFKTERVPDYVILSHTWGPDEDEVTYEQLLSADRDAILHKPGYRKIEQSCLLAQALQLRYVWIDTCCINKSDSAELTESINSMFRWYEEATVCVAYLQDVPSAPRNAKQESKEQEEDRTSAAQHQEWLSTFAASRWLTRGWTLQELLAPRHLQFRSSSWEPIGTREGLSEHIAATTGILGEYLVDSSLNPTTSGTRSSCPRSDLLATASVAQRMSWASNRTTKRPEDMAYCLLGLFGVNMPLIYGEGMNAFTRLQDHIAQNSSDATLLAWNLTEREGTERLWPEVVVGCHESKIAKVKRMLSGVEHPWCASPAQLHTSLAAAGLLAPDPSYFRGCGSLCALVSSSGASSAWSLASNGLTIEAPLSENARPYLLLPCYRRDDPSKLLSLPLVADTGGVYLRSWLPARYVPSETWQQWPKKRLLLSTRGHRTGQSVLAGSPTGQLLLVRSDPHTVQVREAFFADGRRTTDCRLLSLDSPDSNEGTACSTVLLIGSVVVNPDGDTKRFALMIFPAAAQRDPTTSISPTSSSHWKSLVSWHWSLDECEAEAKLPSFTFPIDAYPRSIDDLRLPQVHLTDALSRHLPLGDCHLFATISHTQLGDRRVFALDLHRSRSQVGRIRWTLAHVWIPAVVRIWQSILLSVVVGYTGNLLTQETLEAAFLPYLRILRQNLVGWLSLVVAAQVMGHFAGDYVIQNWPHVWGTVWRRLGVQSQSSANWLNPQWLAVPVFIYHALPMVSILSPQASAQLRKRRVGLAIVLAVPFLCLPLPTAVSGLIQITLWAAAETSQMGWWQRLGYSGQLPSYTALQITYSFCALLLRIFVRAARIAMVPSCEWENSMGVPLNLHDWCTKKTYADGSSKEICLSFPVDCYPDKVLKPTIAAEICLVMEKLFLWVIVASGLIILHWWRTTITRITDQDSPWSQAKLRVIPVGALMLFQLLATSA